MGVAAGVVVVVAVFVFVGFVFVVVVAVFVFVGFVFVVVVAVFVFVGFVFVVVVAVFVFVGFVFVVVVAVFVFVGFVFVVVVAVFVFVGFVFVVVVAVFVFVGFVFVVVVAVFVFVGFVFVVVVLCVLHREWDRFHFVCEPEHGRAGFLDGIERVLQGLLQQQAVGHYKRRVLHTRPVLKRGFVAVRIAADRDECLHLDQPVTGHIGDHIGPDAGGGHDLSGSQNLRPAARARGLPSKPLLPEPPRPPPRPASDCGPGMVLRRPGKDGPELSSPVARLRSFGDANRCSAIIMRVSLIRTARRGRP